MRTLPDVRLPIISYSHKRRRFPSTRSYRSRTSLYVCPFGYVAVALTVTKLKPSRLASETIMTGLMARLLFCIRTERTARR